MLKMSTGRFPRTRRASLGGVVTLCALLASCALGGCSGDGRSLSEDGPDGAAGSGAEGGTGSGGRKPSVDAGRTMDAALPDAQIGEPQGTGGDISYGGASAGGATGMAGAGGSAMSGGGTTATGGAGGAPPVGGAGNGGAGGGSTCGNGKPDPGEQCDDGNTLEDDDCWLCKDARACRACELDQCDADVRPGCSRFTDPGEKAACESVYSCAARTECAFGPDPINKPDLGGNIYCYCGDSDIVSCKAGTAKGPCQKEIDAAFQKYHGDLQTTDAATVVNKITVVTLPYGAALSLWYCDFQRCGGNPSNPDFGLLVCSPTRAPTPAGAGGGAGTGGVGTGGVGTGGVGTGGVGTGGAGTGGNGGTGGAVSYCGGPRPTPVADPDVCNDCELTFCDAPVAPGCSRFTAGSTERTQCTDVLACIRSTNCIGQGNVNCYCGAASIVACKGSAAVATGACKDKITAGFPAGSDAASIVNNIAELTSPAGAALALGQCDYSFCGEVAASECVPYCQ
jgi:cysteine-rich repeat protein